MKILIIGSGGREHAIGWRLADDGHQIVACPGNPGLADIGKCVAIDVNDKAAVIECAKEEKVDLVIIGPEAPLCAGLADDMRTHGFDVFGPGQKAAMLEGSKIFAKQFFSKHGIRTPGYSICDNAQDAMVAIDKFAGNVVVKADGLAAGKGVVVCSSADVAKSAARDMLENKRFGHAGQKILIEEKIVGREVSVMALCDGAKFVILPLAEDHKAVFNGDEGPNTGGMGTVSPPSWSNAELLETIKKDVFDPTVLGMKRDKLDFRGVLFAGVMIDDKGQPWLLEYNVRFGDPETQVVFSRWQGDVAHWLAGTARGELPDGAPLWDERTALCVVMTAEGYPGQPKKGDEISGLELLSDARVFHAGTKFEKDKLWTHGGRVLSVCALAGDVKRARALAYLGVNTIHFNGAHFRTDIGARQSTTL